MPLFSFGNSKRLKTIEQQVKALTITNQYLRNSIALNNPNNLLNNSIAVYPEWNKIDETEEYIKSDHVYSVVNKIAETTSLIPFYTFYQVPDEKKAFRNYETLTNRHFYTSKGLFDIRLMQIKALVDATENDKLDALLSNPNPYQTKNEFFLALYAFYLLNGEAFIYKYRLEEGANAGLKELHIWHPENVIINVTNIYPYVITGYSLLINGEMVIRNAPTTDVIHIKKFNPSCYNSLTELRGLSPLRAACKLLTRLESGDDAAVKQLQNGGSPGIMFDETITNDEINQTQLDEARKGYYDFVANMDNKGLPYISAGKKGYIATGLPLVDLEVIDLAKMDFKRLCNIYKISDIVFNSDVAATESNVQEMIKQMYTNACLPMAYAFRDKLNKELVPEFSDKARYIDVDISGVTELQDDMLKLANTISALPGGLSFNEIRALLKFDADPNPNMDRMIVRQGYQFIDDMAIEPLPPVDQALTNAGY